MHGVLSKAKTSQLELLILRSKTTSAVVSSITLFKVSVIPGVLKMIKALCLIEMHFFSPH